MSARADIGDILSELLAEIFHARQEGPTDTEALHAIYVAAHVAEIRYRGGTGSYAADEHSKITGHVACPERGE